MSTEPFQFSEKAQVVKDFLSRFGGIEIDLEVDFAYLSFSTQGLQTVLKDNALSFIKRVGKPLCLIGVIEEFEAMWFMDAEGRVYEDYPYNDPWLRGYSGEEAIDNQIMLKYPPDPRVFISDDFDNIISASYFVRREQS